jgi:pyrroloquinoline quinone biosynthesis protein D
MNTTVTAQTIPTLRRGVRRHYDTARARNVLLCPERVVLLDDIGNAITELCDGQRSVAALSQILAERYGENPAQVEADVIGFVQELVDKGLVTA